MTVFERTKNMAKKRGISLQETAAKAGLGLNSIYGWKKKEPSIGRLAKVADVLHVSVDYLLGKTDDPEPAQKNKPTEVDINDDDVIMTFEGRPIPPEDIELMKRLLRGGRNDK
ncbi:helix-turn-helix domain-containing protein [Companilactobacillus alimentarius]|uniref:helix-turn-helix domain-containing protein n=1 Tax=Companilactobacillus alimentarius TaxID=1602 RepID=UPI0028B4CE4D|nr:helix-turn-helix transcriptional regulator [Companilactobacillus alimentarius]MDT6953534.1 helix-turn-helix transcriptional regulator [Companilactobacillus alimentarius]MDT6953684.1 helix-turn-helix transcriptional regulator [Companilactobacillus alimentarius]